jgi:hypothetical protein
MIKIKQTLLVLYFLATIGNMRAQSLIHYWNFNDNSTIPALLTSNVSEVSGSSITHIAGGISLIDNAGGTGQDFNIKVDLKKFMKKY